MSDHASNAATNRAASALADIAADTAVDTTADAGADSEPRFSVVIANFNYARYVGEAVRSALDQQGPALEVIVVDDGSSDDSREVLASITPDPRLHVVLQDNRGQAAAFDAGVRRARGEVVCFLDSDDLFLPGKLSRLAQVIDERGLDTANLLLCHDLDVLDAASGTTLAQGWFATMGLDRLGEVFDPASHRHAHPFSIPCGLAIGRELAAACLQAMPSWDFRRGTDSPLCMAALLKCWRVDYLHERLGVYRVHGTNEVARVQDGRYHVGVRLDRRIPRLLAFLERWLDELDLPHAQRQQRLSFLRWLEHFNRVPSPDRRLNRPRVDVVLRVTGGADGEAAAASVEQQSHVAVVLHRVGGRNLAAIAEACAAATGEYLLLIGAGDRLDRECVERHLHWLTQGALVGMSGCDLRLVSRSGSLVHGDVFARSGAWKQHLQQIPPLATRLADWVTPPLAACLLRRTEFLDRLFAEAPRLPPALLRAGGWLPVQLQLHTAGLLRIRETLLSVGLPDGAAASYGYLSAPADLDGDLIEPPLTEARRWLADFYAREQGLFRRRLPPAWHQRFGDWLAAPPPA